MLGDSYGDLLQHQEYPSYRLFHVKTPDQRLYVQIASGTTPGEPVRVTTSVEPLGRPSLDEANPAARRAIAAFHERYPGDMLPLYDGAQLLKVGELPSERLLFAWLFTPDGAEPVEQHYTEAVGAAGGTLHARDDQGDRLLLIESDAFRGTVRIRPESDGSVIYLHMNTALQGE